MTIPTQRPSVGDLLEEITALLRELPTVGTCGTQDCRKFWIERKLLLIDELTALYPATPERVTG